MNEIPKIIPAYLVRYELISRFRGAMELSQSHAASLAGLTKNEWSRYERGEFSMITRANLVKISSALNQSPDDLLFDRVAFLRMEAKKLSSDEAAELVNATISHFDLENE